MVFITILFVLMFQVVGLISLEMNVYITTEGEESNNNISKMASKMKELTKLNELKPKFYLKFGSEFIKRTDLL